MIHDRRTFMLLAGASALAGCSPKPEKVAVPASPAAASVKVVINSLGGLSDPNSSDLPNARNLNDKPTVSARVIDDALASGMNAVNMTLGYVAGDGDPYQVTLDDIAQWDAIVAENSAKLAKVLSAADILAAKEAGKLGLIYGFQNAAMMGEDVARVDEFAAKGVRVIQLTYNIQNQLGGGALAPVGTPLAEFGRQVVERLNAQKIIVDLSHSGEQTCLDAARHSKTAIAITHTGCRALADLPRNKTDEELRLVAEKGGYVGIYFMPFLSDGRQITGDDVVAHIEHAVSVCGEDAIGIGTDGGTTGIDDMEAWKKSFEADIMRRRALGISAPGERPDSFTFAIDMTGPEQFRILADKLGKRGFSEGKIDKILGGNFLRYAKSVWGA